MEGIKYDSVIIGSGPGGYVAAIRCAQLGLKAAIVEKDKTFGGTCLNVGCIPSKALLDSTEVLTSAKNNMKAHGIVIEGDKINADLGRMMERKAQIVGKMTDGVKVLLLNNRVDTYRGAGSLKDAHTVIVEKPDLSKLEINGGSIILAAGSVPMPLKVLPRDGIYITDSTDALSFDKVPGSLAVIGAGAIGLELGSVWNRLGSAVTVIEMMDRILPQSDERSCARLAGILKRQGMDIRVSTRVTDYEIKDGKVRLVMKDALSVESELYCDKVLVAAGRKPAADGLGLAEAGIKPGTGGRVDIDKKFMTSLKGVYAVGDIVRGPMLAHKASEEGIAVSEIIAGRFGSVNYNAIPSIVYTWPEYASVGKTESEMANDGIPYKSGIFQFRANGRALASEYAEGFVKIFAGKEDDLVLGAQIIGPWASDLIGEIVTVMEFQGTSEDIARTVHAHPVLSEVVREAAMDAGGWSIHSLPKNVKGG